MCGFVEVWGDYEIIFERMAKRAGKSGAGVQGRG